MNSSSQTNGLTPNKLTIPMGKIMLENKGNISIEGIQVTGTLHGNKVTINFRASTNETILLLVKRQLANSYMNKVSSDASQNAQLIAAY